MRIMVNENTTMKVHNLCIKKVLKTGIVTCSQVDCLDHDEIDCSECYLDGLGGHKLCVEYSKVKIKK